MSELLNDRYQLGDVIGSGGMGAVYRATDLRLGRPVAVKVLRGGALADDLARSRMRSEANLAASINHPGVAHVYDFDEGMTAHGGWTFIVMQFIEGHTLAQLLREQGRMAPDQVMSVVVQVAEGLQAAHDAGIVHRDLKPANIMLTPAGHTVIVDFGIARSAESEPLTHTGALVGTADYMSPEQAAGRSSTSASDLYSLGVVAYHCLTGTSPFRRESHIATALAHINDGLPEFPPGVPAGVVELITALTAKDPSRRPSSAAAVALRAAEIGAAVTIDQPTTFEMPIPDRSYAPAPPAESSVTTGSRTLLGTRTRRPGVVYAGISLLVVCLAFLGLRAFHPNGGQAVPDVIGMTAEDATARIHDAGMTARPQMVDIAGEPAGRVFKQSPERGKPGPSEGSVRIYVASGKVTVAANKLIGLTYVEASTALTKLGFTVKRHNVAQTAKIGTVLGLDRSGRLPEGATITLSVAVAPAPAANTSGSSGVSSTSSKSASRGGHGNAKGKSKAKKR